jgi:hypothetical protein
MRSCRAASLQCRVARFVFGDRLAFGEPANPGLTGGLLKPDNRHEGRARSAAFSLRLAEPRSTSLPLIAIGGCCHEDRPSGRWPAIYCGWAFLVRTRDGIAPMAAQFGDGRLRRRRRSRGDRPCLVRMAVSARTHLGFVPVGCAENIGGFTSALPASRAGLRPRIRSISRLRTCAFRRGRS